MQQSEVKKQVISDSICMQLCNDTAWKSMFSWSELNKIPLSLLYKIYVCSRKTSVYYLTNIFQPVFSKSLVCIDCRAIFCAKIICPSRAYVRFYQKNKLGNFWELQAHTRIRPNNVVYKCCKKLWGVRHKKIALTVSASTL